MLRLNNTKERQLSFNSPEMMLNNRDMERLKNSWGGMFYTDVFSKIDESLFSVLYSREGAPNFPVNILLSLEIIGFCRQQTLEAVNESYSFDMIYCHAVGETIGSRPVSVRTQYGFRMKLYKYLEDHPWETEILTKQLTDFVNHFATICGVSLNEQRIDSTMFMPYIKKAGRIALVFDVLEKGVNAIPAEHLDEELKLVKDSEFRKSLIYKLKKDEKQTKLDLLLNLSQKALNILKSIKNLNKKGKDAVRILERVIKEQGIVLEDNSIKAKEGKEITSDSLQSAYDEEATYREKADVTQSGYSGTITETCSPKNDVQFITGIIVTPNNQSDVNIFKDNMETIKEITGMNEGNADGGYFSDEVEAKAKELGITMHYSDMTGKEPDPTKFRVDEYEVDATTKTISKCPNGIAPISSIATNELYIARFELSRCDECPDKDKCRASFGKKEAVVRITKKSYNAALLRSQIEKESKEVTSKRAAIEGTNSALKRTGLRKTTVRGLVKNRYYATLSAMAQNCKRFFKYQLGGYKKRDKSIQGETVPNFI